MGAFELARAVADPGLVRREEEQPIAFGPQQRTLVVEQEHLVTREQLDRAQRAVVDAARGHEPQAAVDLGSDPLVALPGAGAAHEIHIPLVQPVQIGQAGAGDRASQVHRGRRVGVGTDEPPRVRPPRLVGRFEPMDHVAAIRRQTGGVGVRGPRLGVLAGDPSNLDDRHRRSVRQDNRHLQQRPDRAAQMRLGVLGEGLGAIPALQQERLAARDHTEPTL